MGGASSTPGQTVPGGGIAYNQGGGTASDYQNPGWTQQQYTPPWAGYDAQYAQQAQAQADLGVRPNRNAPGGPLLKGGPAYMGDDDAAYRLKHPVNMDDPVAKGLTYAGDLVANASATGGAYGMPAVSYGGGPAYVNAAGQYFYDKEGKYAVPAEHIQLGGQGLKKAAPVAAKVVAKKPIAKVVKKAVKK
jgi:hypothetical protein